MILIRKLSLGDNPHGYHVEYGDEKLEHDTYTCQHCGQLVVHRREIPQAWCKRCMGMVCERCAPRGACNPTDNPNREEWLEAIENRERLRRAIDKWG